jgi:hypothetical protein
MKRVNSESNAKQGLSIAESCASSTTVKRYTINCHYDMVISVDVVADNEQQAIEKAREQADRMSLNSCAECVGHSECVTDTEALTAEELRRLEREAVTEFVRRYVGDIIADISYYSQEREPRREFKRKLSRIAYGVRPIHWYCAISRIPAGHVRKVWLTDLYKRLADGTHERTELYNRYARLVARHEFDTHYKNFAKSLYAADCEGTDKLQKKQAVIDGVRCLCDKMEEYVQRQDDPDYKGWEPQMVIRYESTTGDEENYWNLFVYCEGPNDRDDDDYLSLRTSWQHVWTDEDGKDATDDYGSEEHETRAALLRYLFYDDAQDFDETDETVSWERITDVWVD